MSGRVHAEAKAPSMSSFVPVRTGLLAGYRGKLLASQPPLIQAKLTINQPNDRYEQEADRVAEQVMRMAEPLVQRQPEEEEEEVILRTKEAPGQTPKVTPNLEARIQSLKGGGQPLPKSTRTFFEPRFSQDFSQVRIHSNPKATQMTGVLNAKAFTMRHDIVFGTGQYSPETTAGKKLLAHELTHVVQQEVSSVEPRVQRTFCLHELLTPQRTARRPNPVAANPNAYFYPGSARNTSNRRALVVAGIHGTEVSARQLGIEVNDQLSRGMTSTDFHTIVIPRANPTGLRGAGSQSAGTYVPDLNREFGAGYMSPNPYAQRIASIVSEFDPERILSVHAITSTPSAGIFLDPIHTGAYPRVGTEGERRRAFTGDPRNVGAMRLTEAMIRQVSPGGRYTLGNVPRSHFPASEYPTPPGGRSAYSLIYPQQSQVSRSLGTWTSGLGKTVITIEIPGYRAMRTVWSAFLPAVWHFLQIPAPTPTPTPTPVPPTMGHPIQPKLKVGPPGDRYEQEADHVAEQVMQMPEQKRPVVDLIIRKSRPDTLRRACLACKDVVWRQPIEEKEEKSLQTKTTLSNTTAVSSSLHHRIKALRGSGQPLPQSARIFFERRFGIDFSKVRVHADSQAAQTASAVNARAFTFGWDIVFGTEQYEPSASEGRRLLAHELTHVVQQKSMLNNITNSPEAVQRENGYDITQTTIDYDYAEFLNDQNLAEQIELLQDFIFQEGEGVHEEECTAQFNLSILQAEHWRRRNVALTQRYIGFEDTADLNDEDFNEQIQFLEDVIASMSEEERTPEPEVGWSLRFAQFNLAFLQAELRRRSVRETDWRARVRDPDVGLDGRMLYVMELLVDQYRFSVEGAAGLVGNLSRESRVVPNLNELGGGPGRGIVQWTEAGRRQGLFQHEFRGRRLGQAILFDLDAQVDYMVTELQGTFSRLNSYLRGDAVEVAEATRRVLIEYENPQIVVDWRNARRVLEDAQPESDREALRGEVARTERRVDAAAGARRIQAIRARELYRREQQRRPHW